MSIIESIKLGFNKYFDFKSRSSRSEYWYWILFVLVTSLVIMRFIPILLIFIVATVIPSVAVAVRRLHDINRSGWWLLLDFIPVVGEIILVIWCCRKGTERSNRYGAVPTTWDNRSDDLMRSYKMSEVWGKQVVWRYYYTHISRIYMPSKILQTTITC